MDLGYSTSGRNWGKALLLLLPLGAGARSARAVEEPTLGPGQYPQFRNFSGLAGSGYGVDVDGYQSLSGATAFSTPTACVLGHNELHLLFGRTAFTSTPTDIFKNDHETNGTGFGTFGVSLGRCNIAVTDMLLSRLGEEVFHVQGNYSPSPDADWAISFGVQDVAGGGGSAGENQPTDEESSRSFFGVATYRFKTKKAPLYVSAGLGSRRFNGPFGSASYQVAKPVRLWAEYDGYGVNEGLTYTFKPGTKKRGYEFNVLVGLQKSKYFTAGIGFGF